MLGDYVLQNYEQLAFTPINEFSRDVGVSQATIVRFCCALGYEGYLQFSRELQQAIQAKLTTVNRFQLAQKRKTKSAGVSVFEDVISQEIDNVANLAKHVNKSDFYRCMGLMQEADRICVIGCLSSSALAMHFGQMLSKIIARVEVLTTINIMGAAALNKLTPQISGIYHRISPLSKGNPSDGPAGGKIGGPCGLPDQYPPVSGNSAF